MRSNGISATLSTVALLVLLPMSASATHIELVTNGGFETGTLAGWTVFGADLGAIESTIEGGPQAGTYFFIGYDNSGFATLAQTIVSTTIAQIYDFSFYRNQNFPLAAGNILRYQIGGGAIVTTTNSAIWAQVADSFTATSTSTVINIFYQTGIGDGTHRIDSVSFRDTHVVPEPSTALLLGLGLIGLTTPRRFGKG